MKHSGSPGIRASDIWDYFKLEFETLVDDLSGITTSGTSSAPASLIDNTTAAANSFANVNEYGELNMLTATYIRSIRMYGHVGSDPASRYRIQAFVDGAWEDCLTGIVDTDTAAWGAWLDFTTPRTARLWRMECTTRGASAIIAEIELLGVRMGE